MSPRRRKRNRRPCGLRIFGNLVIRNSEARVFGIRDHRKNHRSRNSPDGRELFVLKRFRLGGDSDMRFLIRSRGLARMTRLRRGRLRRNRSKPRDFERVRPVGCRRLAPFRVGKPLHVLLRCWILMGRIILQGIVRRSVDAAAFLTRIRVC